MRKSLIISSYNEDISWLKNIDETIDIFIYEKNNREINLNIKNNHKIIYLENVGREPHSYFTHIVNNYDNLYDIQFFSQDNPFPHCKDFLTHIDTNDEKWLSHTILISNLDGTPNHPGLPLTDFSKMIDIKLTDNKISFKTGCIFSISKEKIQKRTKSYYKNLIDLMVENDNHDFQIGTLPKGMKSIPWMIERLIGKIFDIK